MADNEEKSPTWPLWLAAAFAGFVAFTWFAWDRARRRHEVADAAATGGTIRSAAAEGWLTTEVADEMGRGSTTLRCVASSNSVILDRPYGPVSADLCVRSSSRGRAVFINVLPKAIVSCHDCAVAVKFGDAAVRTFNGDWPASGAANFLFFDGEARFDRGLAGADETKIELNIYQEGPRVFTFRTAGYSPP